MELGGTMTQEERIKAAYEELRLAEMGKRGADEYASDAARDVEACRIKLELLLKATPSRIQQCAS